MNDQVRLLTPTWSGDRPHLDLMRASLDRSALSQIPHDIVVQTEDRERFWAISRSPAQVRTTADFLPQPVESMRRRARHWQACLGRNGARLVASVTRRAGRPRWPAFSGWHAQQLTKLAVTAASEADYVVAVDSDVVVTPFARVDDFIDPDGIVCLTAPGERAQLSRKVWNWNCHAHKILNSSIPKHGPLDTYFDTPFVFHAPTVRRMLDWLESEYRRPWWQVLTEQPPGRWSEFGTYRTFLQLFPQAEGIVWRGNECMRYLFDASDSDKLVGRVSCLLRDPRSHYITIHSQSSGRHHWSPESYADRILTLLDRSPADVPPAQDADGYCR